MAHITCPFKNVFFSPYYQDSRRSFNPQTYLLSTDLNYLNFYVVSKNHSLVYLSRKNQHCSSSCKTQGYEKQGAIQVNAPVPKNIDIS